MNKTHTVTSLSLVMALSLGTIGYVHAANPTTNAKVERAGQAVDDSWITTKVKTELAITQDIPSTSIHVSTKDGVVTLRGILPSSLAIEKAVAVTQGIKGVKSVNTDDLKQGSDSSKKETSATNSSNKDKSSTAGQAIDDAGITTKVKAALLAKDGVSSNNISVTTVDGVVNLVGTLPTEAEVNRAIAATRDVNGVRDVDATALVIKH